MPKPDQANQIVSQKSSVGGCLFSLIRIFASIFVLIVISSLGFNLWYRMGLKPQSLEAHLKDQWEDITRIWDNEKLVVAVMTEDGKVKVGDQIIPLKEVDNACLDNIPASSPPPELWRSADKGFLLKRQTRSTITSLAITPDGKTLISAGNQLEVWDLTARKLIRSLQGHKNFINNVALSRDGEILASGDESGSIIVWNWKTGQILKTLAHDGGVKRLIFSLDGNTLYSGSGGFTIKRWQWQTGKLLHTLNTSIPVHHMIISPDEKTIIFAFTFAGSVEIVSLSNWEQVEWLNVGMKNTSSIALTPNGRILAFGGDGSKGIQLWDMLKGKPFKKLPIKLLRGHQGSPYAMTFSPDAKALFVTGDGDAGTNYAVTVWNACTGERIHRFGSQLRGASIAISADGKTIVTGGARGDILMWQLTE